ncbi:Metallo-dependent hydrolase [Atractiella rhizophila]|nr:Metallo-dependent hydrolase [Atractiella rhizophila]
MLMNAELLGRLTDAHCHPTDHPEWEENALKIADVKLGKIVVMSSTLTNQDYTTKLANIFRDKVVPCYGVHPWFAHHISLENPPPPKRKHYESVFFPKNSDGIVEDQGYGPEDLEEVISQFPEPTSLQDMLSTLRQNLLDHPQAMLGEVGLDRSFRIPRDLSFDPHSDEAHGVNPTVVEATSSTDGSDSNSKPALRFTKLSTPTEHQLQILRAQLHLAIDLQRNISMHSVRAQDITVQVLDSLGESRQDDWWGFDADLEFDENGKEIKPDPSQRWKGGRTRKREGGVKLDLHSYGGSAQTVQAITRKHPNVYFSFSTVINSRSSKLPSLIASIPEDRLLVESDFNKIDQLDEQVEDMVRRVGEAKGWSIEETVERMERNWKEFSERTDF